ncbi:MAG: hypothetical protein IJF56_04820 [Clostridia bacterium]|nr:hypothetical protein [Clostridia bacterium]
MNKSFAKRLCVLLLALCLMLSCTACGMTKGITFAEYIKDYEYHDYYPALNAMEKLDAFTGMDMAGSYNELVAFSDATTYKVYNTDTDTVIAELDALVYSGIEFFEAEDQTFFVTMNSRQAPVIAEPEAPVMEAEKEFLTVDEINEYLEQGTFIYDEESDMCIDLETGIFWTYDSSTGGFVPFTAFEENEFGTGTVLPEEEAPTEEAVPERLANIEVYNAEGTKVAVAESSSDDYTVCEDLFEIGGMIFRVGESGEITPINVNPFFGSIPEIDAKVKDHYYTFDDYSVTVYDSELNATFYWEVPSSSVEDYRIMPLGDNLLVQMITPLHESEDDYDVVDEEGKYDFTSLIIDPVKGDVKEVKLDYVPLYFDSYYEDDEDKEFAVVSMIEDHRVQDAESARKCVKINSKTGAIEAEVFTDIFGTTSLLAEDRFIYRTYSGDLYMLDNKGNSLGKVNMLDTEAYDSHNETFFTYDGRVYDYNLQEVYNYADAGQTVYYMMAHSIIFRDELNHYHLLTADGICQPLDSKAISVAAYKQFYLVFEVGRVVFFDETGVQLGGEVTGDDFYPASFDEEMVIFSVGTTADDTEYYKIFAAPVTE